VVANTVILSSFLKEVEEETDSLSFPSHHSAAPSSLSQQTNNTSQRRVEVDLMRKGQNYLQRREEMKKESEERLLSEHTGKPQLSKYTEKMFANQSSHGFHSLSIGERTKIQLERKKAKEEALKREIEMKMNQEVAHIIWLTD
jgi:hypothetical protein